MHSTATDRAWVASRKGLFEWRRRGGRGGDWAIERVSFLGDPVSMVLPPDARPFRDAFVYGAVIAMLVWRPNGLFSAKAAKQRV